MMDTFIIVYIMVVVIFPIGTFSLGSYDSDDEEDCNLKR